MKLKTIYQTTIAVVFSVAVGLSTVYAEEPKTLSSEEIKKAITGNTMDMEKAFIYWKPDGTLSAKSKRGGTDGGKWWIKDDGIYCRKWNTWRGGSEDCSRFKKSGNDYATVRLDGTVRTIFKILKGNPEGL